MADLQRYEVVTTNETTGRNEDGSTLVIPARTIVNEILWDGVSDYTSPADTELILGG